MKLINYIKEEEFFKLVKAEKKEKFKLAYKFAFGSGLRISEIIGFGEALSKCHNAPIVKTKESIIIDGEKKKRTISKCVQCNVQLSLKDVQRNIHQWQIKPLTKEQIDLQAKTIKVIGGKGMKDRIVPLFPNFKESDLKLLPLAIKRSTLQIHFSTLCKKVLGRHANFHQLRHGFGVMSTKKKVPMPFLQQALGHSRLDTTGIYTAASPEDMLEGYRKAWGEI